jgi:hypothetical protein
MTFQCINLFDQCRMKSLCKVKGAYIYRYGNDKYMVYIKTYMRNTSRRFYDLDCAIEFVLQEVPA